MNKNIAIVVILFLSNFSNAQPLAGKTRVDSNALAFRWAPFEYSDYKTATEKGFRFQIRKTLNSDLVLDTLIKPWNCNDSRWKENEKRDKRFTAVYDFLHGQNSIAKSEKEKSSIQMYYGFMLLMCDTDSLLAQAMGLYWVSDSIKGRGNEYSVAIESLPQTKLLFQEPQLVMERPVDKINLKCRSKSAVLSWNTENVVSDYSSYCIERSWGNSDFVRVNQDPFVELFTGRNENPHELYYYDTIAIEHQKYSYRIRGITHFGTLGPPSEPCSCYLFPEMSCVPEIDTIIATSHGLVIRRKIISESDLVLVGKSFITKSSSENSRKMILYETKNNRISELNFVDSFPDRINYYTLNTIHLNGDTLKSFAKCYIVPDTIAPVPPSEIHGQITNDGMVEISWEDIDEKELKGYRVFRRHSNREDWHEQNTGLLEEPFFSQKINLQTLDSTLEYAVTATDSYYNCSRYSSPIVLKIPDVIPPSKVIFTKALSEKGKIILNWKYTETEPTLSCALFRIQKQIPEVILKFSKKLPANSFQDTTLMNNPVQYCIQCTDVAGNFSVSDTMKITPISIEDQLNIELTGKADRINHAIFLLWKINSPQSLRVQIYKSDQSRNFYPVQSLNGITAFYRDKNVHPGNMYWYKIGVQFNSGRKFYSEEVKVVY